MKKTIIMALVAAGFFCGHSRAEFNFKVHVFLKENSKDWAQTGILDFNGDGKLDFVAGQAFSGPIFWWENTGDLSTWKRHTVDEKAKGNCVGGDVADVDGDGITDFVSSGWWYKGSPSNTTEKPRKIPYNGGKGMPGKSGGCHDIVTVDIDGDGKLDAMNHSVTWWKNPGKEAVNTNSWESHQVASRGGYHGAIAPKGWGDIDGDGDNDVVGIGEWFKNVNGDGTKWEAIKYASWSKKNENRVWVADFDGDGDQDIAAAEGDYGNGTAAWFQNIDGKGQEFKTILLPLDGLKGDLHSVGGLDFDGDGDLDIFVGQNNEGDQNEWMIFDNTDGKGAFEKQVIYKGWGTHETVYADLDDDGDIDIMGKCWCDPPSHFLVLENKLDPVRADFPAAEKSLKDRLSFSARIAYSGRGARLLVSSKAPGPNTLELFDIRGNTFMTLENMGSADNSIPLQGLHEGVYLIRLNAQEGAITEKIVYKR